MDRDQVSIQNRSGLLFFLSMNQAFGSVIGCSQVIPTQLKVVNRERAANLYDAISFYAAAFAVNLPLETLPQFINCSVVYFMVNLRSGVEHFLVFIGVLMLENFAGIALGMVISAWLKNVEMAPQVAPAFVVFFLMFSGFLINEDSVPAYLIWVREISFIRYAFRALCVNEFRGATFACNHNINSAAVVSDSETPCLSGDQVLERLNFQTISIAEECYVLIGIMAAFHIVAYLILVRRKPKFLTVEQNSDSGIESPGHLVSAAAVAPGKSL